MAGILGSMFVEGLETRRFYDTTYYNDGSQAGADGTYFGVIMYGDNGDENGVQTSASGASDNVLGQGFYTWDSDMNDGLDSGTQDAVFAVNTTSSHTAMFNVANYNSGMFGVGSSPSIHSVTLRAAVTAPGMEFTFSEIRVEFFSGSSIVETVHLNDLDADTRNSTSWDPAEAAAVVTPHASNVSGVQVTAAFRMKTNAGTYPGPTDVSGQIFVS